MAEGDPEPPQVLGLDVRGLEVMCCTGYLGYPVRPTVPGYMGKRSQDCFACSLASAPLYSHGEHVTGRQGELIPLEQINEPYPHGGVIGCARLSLDSTMAWSPRWCLLWR
jgi:hypothetical protein